MSAALQTAELSPEKLAFIRAGTPQSEVTRAVIARAPAQVTEIAPAPVAAREPGESAGNDPTAPVGFEAPKAAKPRTTREREPERSNPGALISMSIRVPPEIPDGLVRASADRKIKRQRPFTQQQIAAEAIALWLRKNGYLP